jgi:hypothetical protein
LQFVSRAHFNEDMHKRIPLSAQVAQGSGGDGLIIDGDRDIIGGLSVETSFQYASYLIFGMQILMILLLGAAAKDNFIAGTDFSNYYNMFTGTEIMMFIGFGYLMTFLKRYGMGAVGLTMLVTLLGLEWGIFTEVCIYLQWLRSGNGCGLSMLHVCCVLFAVVLCHVVRDDVDEDPVEHPHPFRRSGPSSRHSDLVRRSDWQDQPPPAGDDDHSGVHLLFYQQEHFPRWRPGLH